MPSQDLDTPFGSINIYLQSRDAAQTIGTNGANCVWFLNTPVSIPRPDVKMLCAVTDFQCAYSWYIIRTGINDKFAFSDQAGASVKVTITIPEGNYNATTFKNKLNQLIGTDRITYDKGTNKFTYTSATGTNTVIIFNKENGTTCDTEVGMENSTDQTGTGSKEFPNMVDFAGIPYVYIIGKTLGLENRNSSGDINLTLCKIPVTVQPLGFIYMPVNAGLVYLHLNDREIKKLQIVLEDDEGNEIDFHGIGWGLTLTIHYQYARLPQANKMILGELNKKNEPDE
jgi:hypothetical protein|tara:strand:- start:1668 stop:2519 length:852 start_codon:yes stop_codon:yes gene_type:complete